MKLATRYAARMNIRARMKKTTRWRPSSWPTISLRWRTMRRPAPTPAVHRSPQADAKAWSPQFHLHFSRTGSATDGPCQISPAPLRTTAISWRHFDQRLTSVLPIVRTHSVSGVRNVLQRMHWDVVQRYRTTRETTTAAPVKPGAGSPPRTLQSASRAAGTLLAQEAAIRIWGRRSAAVGPVEGDAPRRRRLSPMALTLSDARRNRSAEAGAMPAKAEQRRLATIPRRAPELVWRAHQKDSVTTLAETSAGPAASQRPLSATPAVPATWQTQGDTTARVLPLDAAMVDRLTEDVIRRVERRVRIERERRGV